ncbi:MAG TPA: DUF3343 domain-containing protein [Clostridia bacterium]|nr:DUF3343 domain-containing protein [Clostridia bacterium]
MEYCVATFPSVYEALHFEKVLKSENIHLELIPVPREISSSCGIAAKFTPKIKNQVEAVAAAKNLVVDHIYTLEEKGNKKGLLDFLP